MGSGRPELLLLAAALLQVSALTFRVATGTSYNISNSPQGSRSKCLVCTGEGRSQTCSWSLLLPDPGSVSVDFKCDRPEDVIQVEILQKIDCTTQSCNGDIMVGEPDPLRSFNRTFVWTMKAVAPKTFLIDFTKQGLRQIPPSQACPDKQTFTLQATGKVAVGTYCRGGPVSAAQVLTQGTFSLRVPAREPLHPERFNVSVGPDIKSLAKLRVVVPAGGPVELLSPNFPESFPDDDLVDWEFWMPTGHQATVTVLNHTLPACRKKEAAVEYHIGGRSTLLLGLAQPQPARNLPNFTMTLKNCEMNRARGNPRGLSAHFRVSSVRAGVPVFCPLDHKQMKGLSIKLETVSGSKCQMRVDSNVMEAVVVSSYSLVQLSFQDCSQGDILVTASRVIECRQLKDCPEKPVPLPVPTLPVCLPGPLRRVTWTLVPPAGASAQLLGPKDGLKQSLPGQLCESSTVLSVAVDDGRTPLGQFCSPGPLQSIRFRTNVSVTASGAWGGVLPSPLDLLGAHFKDEILEKYVFSVSPRGGPPSLLASPGWPAGMTSHSTVSWIVEVPARREAVLVFTNLSQPKCSNRHANIRVQLLGSPEEIYSRREDEEVAPQLVAPRSFYLNMSNCLPETGQFSVLTQLTLRKSTNLLLPVVVGVVGGLLLLSAVLLAVVCVVIRKKKREMNRNQVSIYNPAGTTFLPGQSHLPGSEEDEYHVYASIEDTLVYTHLLRKMETQEEGQVYADGPSVPRRPPVTPEVGTYRPFTGAPPAGPPVPQANRPSSPDMVLNDLYDPDGQSDLGTPKDHSPGASSLGARMDPEGGD